jgi:aryl-alcohol dehydrogenase-like predicted oxidoreductase
MASSFDLPGGDFPRSASAFCLGASTWGSRTRGDDLDHLYDAFRAAGGNFFDSAHVYAAWLPGGTGASERALGEIVRRRGDRRNVILATKGGHPALDTRYPRPDRCLTPHVIAQDIAESLDRLGDDAIDLYYLHRDDPRVPVGEIIDLLHEHVAAGRIKRIGASNWKADRIAAANAYAAGRGRSRFVVHQAKYSLAWPNPSKDLTSPPFDADDVAWHASSRMPLCAYSSTANGYFATHGVKGAGGWQNATSAARLRQADRVASEIGATPNQVALAWLLRQPFPIVPVLGTTSVDHLADALAAATLRLSADQVRSLTVAPGTSA